MEANTNINQEIIITDYKSRRLDKCGVCNEIYNVGDKIPRILINCGHTYCTSCLTKYYRKNRIRCPFCKKLVKHLESVEQLPLNISIFSEVIKNDEELLEILDTDSKNSFILNCPIHNEKIQHFYCSHHRVNFCRECIRISHREDECCVVDLDDINKLFDLNEQNSYKNYLIFKTRNKAQGTKINRKEFFIANN